MNRVYNFDTGKGKAERLIRIHEQSLGMHPSALSEIGEPLAQKY